MRKMVTFAGARKLYKLGLFLLNSSWGRSNLLAAETYLKDHPQFYIQVTQWFNWSDDSLLEKHQQIIQFGAEAILFVGNDIDAIKLLKSESLFSDEKRLPIISHWGVSGGRFHPSAAELLDNNDFSVRPNLFSFIGKHDPKSLQVLEAGKRLFGMNNVRAMESPAGLAHAYDLTHILAKAIKLAGTTERSKVKRRFRESKKIIRGS